MPAMHLSRVDFPDPLRPTIPKNSPWGTEKEMSSSARRRSKRWRRSGWSARSLSVWTRSRGSEKVLEALATMTAGKGWLLTAKRVSAARGASAGSAEDALEPPQRARQPPARRRHDLPQDQLGPVRAGRLDVPLALHPVQRLPGLVELLLERREAGEAALGLDEPGPQLGQ